MRVGLVYDLRDDYRRLGFSEEAVAEFDSPETIDALAEALAGQGLTVDRIGHIRALAARLVAGEHADADRPFPHGVDLADDSAFRASEKIRHEPDFRIGFRLRRELARRFLEAQS